MKDLSVYVLVSFIACVTPGSGVLYTVTNGLRGGLRTVLASPLGTTLGVGLMSLISATGLGALITYRPHSMQACSSFQPPCSSGSVGAAGTQAQCALTS